MNLFYKIKINFFLYKLKKNFKGDLTIIFPNKSIYILGKKKSPYFKIINNFIFIRILLQGVSGISYGYYKGEWTTNNLAYIVRLGIANIRSIKSVKIKENIIKIIKEMLSFNGSNTITKSKKQIRYHLE